MEFHEDTVALLGEYLCPVHPLGTVIGCQLWLVTRKGSRSEYDIHAQSHGRVLQPREYMFLRERPDWGTRIVWSGFDIVTVNVGHIHNELSTSSNTTVILSII